MKTKIVRGKTVYVSEVMPQVRTSRAREGAVLNAADRQPVLYRIVTSRRSRAWGIRGPHYAERGIVNDAAAVVGRLSTLLDATGRTDVLGESARFTSEHYDIAGFTGGEFVLHGEHPLCTLVLDYTPETLKEVIESFLRWAGATPGMPASTVRLNGTVVHRLIDLAALTDADTTDEEDTPVKDLMIVDDEELVRNSVRRMLRDEGFALIHEASNGREALDLLKALAARDELPALIVTDCSMPGMDGISLTRAVRAEPSLSAIPIIVCSGDDANAKPASELGVPFFFKGHDKPDTLKLLARALTKTQEEPDAAG